MTLDKVRKGNRVKIIRINNSSIKSQAIRIGLAEGSVFTCSEKLSGGPVVLQNRMQEIAIGKGLASSIEIEGVE